MALAVVGACAWVGGLARADDLSVPISLQVDLLNRVAAYERGYASVASEAVVLVVSRRGNAESVRAAGQIEARVGRSASLGGRPARVAAHAFTTPPGLLSAVQSERAAIVYLTPGLDQHVGAIADALDGVPVMTVSSVGSDAERGAVLAFELVAARPTLVVNLRQARRQRVEFSSQLLRLARVIQ